MLEFCLVHPHYFVAVNVHNIMLIKGISKHRTEVYLAVPDACLTVDANCSALRTAVTKVLSGEQIGITVFPDSDSADNIPF